MQINYEQLIATFAKKDSESLANELGLSENTVNKIKDSIKKPKTLKKIVNQKYFLNCHKLLEIKDFHEQENFYEQKIDDFERYLKFLNNDRQKQIIELRFNDELKIDEISKKLDISTVAVHKNIKKALKTIENSILGQ